MRKTIVFSVLIALGAMILDSCASGPPRVSGPDDCLVLIKSNFVHNTMLTDAEQSGRFYEFNFSGGYPKAWIKPDYTVVVVKEPAVNIVSISTGPQPPCTGPTSQSEASQVLPYKPGSVVIADFVFEKRTERTSSIGLMTYSSLRKITDREREALLEKIKHDSAFKGWKI